MVAKVASVGKKAKASKKAKTKKAKKTGKIKLARVAKTLGHAKKKTFAKRVKQKKIGVKQKISEAESKPLANGRVVPSRDEVLNALRDNAVKSFLLEVGGENALKVVEGLADPISAEELAKKIDFKVSGVRVVLNKLHSQGLAEYTKVRNSDSGWYLYVWNIRLAGVYNLLEEKNKMVKLLENIPPPAREEKEDLKNFFACPKCNSKVSFEEAMDLRFKCGECGKALKNLNGNGFGK